ncbi:hypothetical protein [Streptosporangium sp. NPDC023615]|uniref:hypothetical protein n=1 Tax=Streptosporangium sp. NPDC023615 TaxID=3154794 RepID=UPI0034127D1C
MATFLARSFSTSVALVTAIALIPGTANAISVKECGSWWPSQGSMGVHKYNGNLEIGVEFTFSEKEIESLRCTRARGIEVDFVVENVVQKYGDKEYYSDLPKAYADTEFDDPYSTRVLTIGSADPGAIKADVPYYVNIHLNKYVRLIDKTPTVYLNFQRGHWASKFNPKEAPACARGRWKDPKWCIFATETILMSKNGLQPFNTGNSNNFSEIRSW